MGIGTDRGAVMFLLIFAFAPGTGIAQSPAFDGRPTQVPAAVYSRLFREVVDLEARADRLAAKGQPDAALRHHHQLWLDLTAGQERQLKQVAANWARQNAPLDIQAGHARGGLERVRRGSAGTAAAQDAEVKAIAAQQVALTESARQALARAFGPPGFAYFESTVRRYGQMPAVSRNPRPETTAPLSRQSPQASSAP